MIFFFNEVKKKKLVCYVSDIIFSCENHLYFINMQLQIANGPQKRRGYKNNLSFRNFA